MPQRKKQTATPKAAVTTSRKRKAADGDDRAIPSGDRPSFRRVYETTRGFVKRTARRWGVDESDVDDVSQEVFLAIHRRLHDFEGRSSVKTWVAAILQGFVLNYRRSRRRHCGCR